MNTFRLMSRTNIYAVLGGTVECVEGVTEVNGRRYVVKLS